MINGSVRGLLVATIALCLATAARAQTDEEVVGRAGAAQLLSAAPLSASAPAQQYLNLVGYGVAQYSGASYKWHFGVIKSDVINAFALPGGYVLLSAGLLKMLDNEDELAFVVAHEIAHATRRHHYQVVQRQRLAEQASTNLQSTGQADSSKLSRTSAQIYARGLDKFAEFDSDRLGVEYITRTGYDPAAALTVLEKLQKVRGDDPRAELLFSTHPSPSDRLDMLVKSGIDSLSRPSGPPSPARDARFKAFRDAL